MDGKFTRVLAAALLIAGVGSGSVALAQGNTPTTPQQPPTQQQPPGQTQGPGMMGGQGTMGGQNMMGGGGNMSGMMGMMNAMTRMANTCNSMMENAKHTPASPGTSAPGESHG